MEYNVNEATKLYSQAQEETNLVYPTYQESVFGKLEMYDLADKNVATCQHPF